VNLWKRLYRDEGLQMPRYDGLDEHVFESFTRMYEAFERDRKLIGPGQYCEVRYEELIADPVAQMRRVYEELQLGDFQSVRPGIEAYFAGQKDYKTNRYQITPETRAEIGRRWGKYIEQYGYAGGEVGSR
jgi:LPS sulfotransferase NodH